MEWEDINYHLNELDNEIPNSQENIDDFITQTSASKSSGNLTKKDQVKFISDKSKFEDNNHGTSLKKFSHKNNYFLTYFNDFEEACAKNKNKKLKLIKSAEKPSFSCDKKEKNELSCKSDNFSYEKDKNESELSVGLVCKSPTFKPKIILDDCQTSVPTQINSPTLLFSKIKRFKKRNIKELAKKLEKSEKEDLVSSPIFKSNLNEKSTNCFRAQYKFSQFNARNLFCIENYRQTLGNIENCVRTPNPKKRKHDIEKSTNKEKLKHNKKLILLGQTNSDIDLFCRKYSSLHQEHSKSTYESLSFQFENENDLCSENKSIEVKTNQSKPENRSVIKENSSTIGKNVLKVENSPIYSKQDIHDETSDVLICSCSSLKFTQNKEESSPFNSIESLSYSPKLSTQKFDTKKGSHWVQNVAFKTPEKLGNFSQNFDPVCTSIKKKTKKGGFADQLERLIYSWESNKSIWNHQLHSVQNLKQLKCSLSPKNVLNSLDCHSSPNNVLGYLKYVLSANNQSRDDCELEQSFSDKNSAVSQDVILDSPNNKKSFGSQKFKNFKNPEFDHLNFQRRIDIKKSPDNFNASQIFFSNKTKSQENHQNSTFLCKNEKFKKCLSMGSLDNKNSNSEIESPKWLQNSGKNSNFRNYNMEIQSPNVSQNSILSKCSLPFPEKHLCVIVHNVLKSAHNFTLTTCIIGDSCTENFENVNLVSNNFYVIFANDNITDFCTKIEVNNKIKIFAPWHVLRLDKEAECTSILGGKEKHTGETVIFVTYFVKLLENIIENSPLKRENSIPWTKIGGWNCSCAQVSYCTPHEFCSCVEGRIIFHISKTNKKIKTESNNTDFFSIKNENVNCVDFITVREQENSEKTLRYWTVLDAIERRNGREDKLVAITITVKFVHFVSKIPESDSYHMVLGQDPSGIFLVIKVPNRPLFSTLSTILFGSHDSVRTLTNLSVIGRITDTQDPGLFSLIRSFQKNFNEIILKDSKLLAFFKPQMKRSNQTSCYEFLVNLGLTQDQIVPGTKQIGCDLPLVDFEVAFSQEYAGLRVTVEVFILGLESSVLYVSDANLKINLHENNSVKNRNISNSQYWNSQEHSSQCNTEGIVKKSKLGSTVKEIKLSPQFSIPNWLFTPANFDTKISLPANFDEKVSTPANFDRKLSNPANLDREVLTPVTLKNVWNISNGVFLLDEFSFICKMEI